MTNDGLSSVALGREGTGEAVLLKGSPSTELAKIYAQDYKLREAKKAKDIKDIADLKGDVPIAKWTAGNYNYYGPELNNWRSKAPLVMAAVQKETDPYKREILKRRYEQEGASLKRQVEIDNQTFENWGKEIADRRSNPEKYSDEIEIDGQVIPYDKAIEQYADPIGTGKAKEVQDAGGLAMWRVQNLDKYRPQLVYDRNKDLNDEVAKVKLSEWSDQEPERLSSGFYRHNVYKGVPKSRIESEHDTYWSRKDNKGKKWRQSTEQMADDNVFVVRSVPHQGPADIGYEQGQEDITEGLTGKPGKGVKFQLSVKADAPKAVVDAVQKLNADESLTIEEKKKRLPKEISLSEYRDKLPTEKRAYFSSQNKNTFNFGPGDSTGVGEITDMKKIVKRVYGGQTVQDMASGEGFQFDPVDVTIQTPEILYNSETGQRIKDSEVRNISFGELQVLPVVAKNIKIKDMATLDKGLILTNNIMKKPSLLKTLVDGGYVKYEVIGYGSHMKNEGSGSAPVKESYYTTLNHIGARLTTSGDKKSMALKKKIQDLQKIADEKNSSIGQSDSRSAATSFAQKR